MIGEQHTIGESATLKLCRKYNNSNDLITELKDSKLNLGAGGISHPNICEGLLNAILCAKSLPSLWTGRFLPRRAASG